MTDVFDAYATWDAPYVLGSLTKIERTEYEQHLASCPECRSGVSQLAGLPGMLALVDTDTALAMINTPDSAAPRPTPPTPQLLPRLAAAAERRRHRRRLMSIGGAIAAAAAAVAIAIPVVNSITESSNPPAVAQVFAERQMQPLEPTPVSASFKLIADGDRTRVVMTCSYGQSDQQYSWKFALFVTRTDGQQAELGQWPAGPGTELTIDRAIDGSPDQVRSVEIRSVANSRTLLVGTV